MLLYTAYTNQFCKKKKVSQYKMHSKTDLNTEHDWVHGEPGGKKKRQTESSIYAG